MVRNYRKSCPKCRSQKTKKDGKRKGRQSYKCNTCSHIRLNKKRTEGKVNCELLYQEFALRKQTYKEISARYGISIRSVQTYLDQYVLPDAEKHNPSSIILLIDTTYFGKRGLMVFKDAENGSILHHEIVPYETNHAYRRGIAHLLSIGREIKAIVCDGRRGLLGGFKGIPTQMCHFHQMQIMRRYITKNPKLEPNRELKEITQWLTRTERCCLENELDRRYRKHKDFVNERGINGKGKRYYIHRRTRSAYLSLRRNMKYLFVYHDYHGMLLIPNTTNGIEAVFSHLKYKVNLHRGLRLDRKLKLIKYLLISR